MATPNLSSVQAFLHDAVLRHAAVSEGVRGMNVPYTRRGVMSIPAFRIRPGADPETEGREQSLRVMRKATTLPVDFFFYDLEDATPEPPRFKALARGYCVEALNTLDFGTRVVAFRPNNIRTPHFEPDLLTVVGQAGHRLQACVLPKVESVQEVVDAAKAIRDIQRLCNRKNRIMLEVLIESPRGLLAAERIAAHPDVSALVLGPYDWAKTLGIPLAAERWLTDLGMIRQTLPVLAAAYGKDAVDGITGTLPVRPAFPPGTSPEDHAALLRSLPAQLTAAGHPAPFVQAVTTWQHAVALAQHDAQDARQCGFAAKWILHPDQIEPVQGAWTPSMEQARQALDMAVAYARAALAGSGAEVQGTQLVDRAVVATGWWQVEAALRAGMLSDKDAAASGFTLNALRQSVGMRVS